VGVRRHRRLRLRLKEGGGSGGGKGNGGLWDWRGGRRYGGDELCELGMKYNGSVGN